MGPSFIEYILGITELRSLSDAGKEQEGVDWLNHMLRSLQVEHELVVDNLSSIPSNGCCIFVSNHPTGILDGILLFTILIKQRPDLKMIINKSLIDLFPKTARTAFGVSPPSLSSRHLPGVIDMYKHLKAGKPILIFPAGRVGLYNSLLGFANEAEWSPKLVRVIRQFPGHVVPIYIEAYTSIPFFLTRIFFFSVAKYLLFRELLFQRGKTIKVWIGKPIHQESIGALLNDKELLTLIRERTLNLPSSNS